MRLSVKHHHSKIFNSSVMVENISRFVIAFSKKRRGGKNKFTQLRNTAHRLLKTIRKSKMKINEGIGFGFSGRAYGAKKAASFKVFVGSVPLTTLNVPVDYTSIAQQTKNGTWGFHGWLNCSSFKRKTLSRSPSLNFFQKYQREVRFRKKIWKKK